MKIKAEDFIKVIESQFDKDDEIEFFIGSGQREYPVADIQKGLVGSKLVFATEGYVNYKRKRQELL